MCNSCNCDDYDKCSIVGYMPIGFCCEKCILYDEKHTCLKAQLSVRKNLNLPEDLKPISTSIEGGLLKVVIKQKGKEVPLYIDIKKQLESK
ncbi:MAG: hypothetical protein EU529_12855 [Promethearchaeota archaeon]|nr:MAG: hypothetical protein EU529_12855 [Candidatus Lokiarchaeota archaeon]